MVNGVSVNFCQTALDLVQEVSQFPEADFDWEEHFGTRVYCARTLSKRVAALIQTGKSLQALKLLENNIRHFAEHPVLLFQLSQLLLNLKPENYLAKAESVLAHAWRNKHDNRRILQSLGDIAAQTGRTDLALACFQKTFVLEERKTDGKPNVPIGKIITVLMVQGRVVAAEAICRALLRAQPDDDVAKGQLVQILLHPLRGRAEHVAEAEAICRARLKAQPGNGVAKGQLAKILNLPEKNGDTLTQCAPV